MNEPTGEIMTMKEARVYCKERLKIGDTSYNECVLPLIRKKFKPILKNTRRRRPAHKVIKRLDLEQFIDAMIDQL